MVKYKLENRIPAPNQRFIYECEEEHRIPLAEVEDAPEVENPDSFICRAITEGCGKYTFTQPRMCAKCQLKGKVDLYYISQQIQKRLGVTLTHVLNGFYTLEESKQIIRLAYKTFGKHPKGRGALRRLFENLVGTGKMSMEEAEQFIKTELPELEKDESIPETAEANRQPRRIILTIPSPAVSPEATSEGKEDSEGSDDPT